MKIVNVTKKTVIADRAAVADTFFSRMAGLIPRKGLSMGEALVIKPCNSIHTFFMRFPIDVLFVDRHGAVVKILSSIKPNRISGLYCAASRAVELPAGTIEATATAISDILSFE